MCPENVLHLDLKSAYTGGVLRFVHFTVCIRMRKTKALIAMSQKKTQRGTRDSKTKRQHSELLAPPPLNGEEKKRDTMSQHQHKEKKICGLFQRGHSPVFQLEAQLHLNTSG